MKKEIMSLLILLSLVLISGCNDKNLDVGDIVSYISSEEFEALNQFNEIVNNVTGINCSFPLSNECVEELYNNGSGKVLNKGE